MLTLCLSSRSSLLLLAQLSLPTMPTVGGKQDIPDAHNDVQLEDLARFAVLQYNIKEKSDLEYVRLVSAQKQVVAGIMYYLRLEAAYGGETKLYEAKVWVKVWENFKSLEDFKLVC